jgi:hypothetical protein
MLQPAWKMELQDLSKRREQAGRHWVSVAKYTLLPSSVFIVKLLRDL